MARIKLKQMPESEIGKMPGLKFEGEGKLTGHGNETFVCGTCDRVFAENMMIDQLQTGMPMFCGDCKAWFKLP